MGTSRSLLAGLLVGALGATLGAAAAEANPPVATGPGVPAPVSTPPPYGVTLLTGDRVTVTGDGQVVVRPGEGRDGVSFVTRRSGQSTYVIPSDAVPLLAEDRLDLQLFDVALLREFGFDDERDDLPLIVTHDGAAAAASSTVAAQGAEVVGDLPAVDGIAVRVDKAGAVGFWDGLTDGPEDARTMAGAVSTVWLDSKVELLLDESVPQVGAPAAWDLGLDGTGVTVAVLDTGIDANHPDLVDQVVGQRNFTEGEEDDRDLFGHGTHVGSIVAGTGAASDGRYQGVAPGAKLLDGKVCSLSGDCRLSWILAGMQWAAEQGAAVVNMSLGYLDPSPMDDAVERLTDEYGVLFVAAAGNEGPPERTIRSPARTGAALAVGAVEKDGEIAFFSSRGPASDGTLKPDLTAPGVGITAAGSQDGQLMGGPGQTYWTDQGTSMAAPHVAGAAAILAQQHPEWTPAQLAAALTASAAPHPAQRVDDQGAGLLDVARAITQTVTTSPASVSFDQLRWPHEDGQPQTRTITYRNGGEAEVTLDLALTTTGPDGAPAPEGTFTLGASRVTVPAGGSAGVELTADAGATAGTGYFGGWLTAAGPDVVVTTAFGIDREPERYELTLVHTDRDGEPATDYITFVARHGEFGQHLVSGEPEATLRLPPGDYLVESYQFGEQADTALVQPLLELTADQSVELDARSGAPVTVAGPDPAAVPQALGAAFTLLTGEFAHDGGIVVSDGVLHTAQVGPDRPVAGFATRVGGVLARPTPDPTAYHLAWFVEGRFPTGFHREAAADDLAAVRADHAAQVPGSAGFKAPLPTRPDLVVFGPTMGVSFDLPLTRTDYVNTDDGAQWWWYFEEAVFTDEAVEWVVELRSLPTAYRAGRTYHERWNYGVFGPVPSGSDVFRFGDELVIAPSLYGDGAGHVGSAPFTGTITVFQDGELILDEPSGFAFVTVPPEPADYRVEVEAQRLGSAPLSRETSVAWEFRSGHAGDDFVPVPVLGVRFSPNLGPDGSARAGRPLLIPVTVDGLPGVGTPGVTSLSVAVSFDDGDSWQDARVIGRHVLVRHPRDSGFVSLRATAADAEGHTVEQTIIRAYPYR